MDLPQLKTKRLRLRPLTYNDTDRIFEIFSNPDVTRYWGHDTLEEKEEANEFIQRTISGSKDESLLEWGIISNQNQELIGTCALSGLDQEHHRAEVGFALHPQYWGNGYMIEALPAILRFGFIKLKLHRIEADVDPRNSSSINLLEKFNFQKEGLMRERYFINGEIQDALFYGLLRSEFKRF
ncbi:GNAT family N-acetyltransferase [Balneolaceae bacterium YR4-1]|uniref:GNAT family N-acetyltransferase n=1 Tax=Halalkalibaculum roseum TaxID=2709311 RepID=A0A6M1SUE8_9BACT|nr:GNAT family protein [Halalkalibaculum roseum]NGP75756.1 GNAT family N-acetyltransferase [Halalkalibaculum roseum]